MRNKLKHGQNLKSNVWTFVTLQLKASDLFAHQVSLQTPKRNLFIQTQETPNPSSLKVPLTTPFQQCITPNLIAVFTWSDCIGGRRHIWRSIYCSSQREPSGKAFVQVQTFKILYLSKFNKKSGSMAWRPSSLVATSSQWPSMMTRGWSGRWATKDGKLTIERLLGMFDKKLTCFAWKPSAKLTINS